MARYRASLKVPRSQEEAFAYMSNFANTEEWDPGVVEAKLTTAATIGEGSEFSVRFRLPGTTTLLTYRIVNFDPPRSVTLLAEGGLMTSRDRIDVAAIPTGAEITYDAELTLTGPLRLADPVLQRGFHRTADRALAGLRRVMNG